MPDTDTRGTTEEHTQTNRQRSWFTRLTGRALGTYRRAGMWLGQHIGETHDWARQQRPRMLAQAAALSALALLAAYWALRLLWTIVSSLFGWIFGSNDTADPAPAPDSGSNVSRWIANLDHHPVWAGLWENIAGWVEHQAGVVGVPMPVLLIGWAVVGALLLFGTAFHVQDHLVPALCWWAWLAATCWLIWTCTPGNTPVPAVAAAAVGVAASSPLGPLVVLAAGAFGVVVGVN